MRAIILIEVGPDQGTGCMMTPGEVHDMLISTVVEWEFDKIEVIVEGYNEELEPGGRKLQPLTPLKKED